MSHEPPPDPLRPKTRLPFEPGKSPFSGAARRGGLVIIAILAITLTGLTLYMAFILRHPLTSAYVVAPAIGAAWFLLRLVMMLGPKR